MISWDMDAEDQVSKREAKFKVGEDVVDPISGLRGTVVKVDEPQFDWMGFQYAVVLSNGTRTMFQEDSLQECFNTDDIFELCQNRNFASYDDYMIVNTLFKIDNVNNNTISTLRASRTQFKAYQFKPLLKFFSSPEKRILIADEVGLGKTIEAGHILLELRARKEFRHALIVCPKSLREKWKSEMDQRFGIDFTIYGGEDNEGNKYPSMADLYNAYLSGRDVHAIVNYERIRYKRPRRGQTDDLRRDAGLVDFILKNEIRQSVVICDESHRLRNEGTLSYAGAEILLQKSDAVVFLTATPVMIKEDNLYNQMHLLCPEKYSDAQMFSNRMSQGRPFVLALGELCAGYDLKRIWSRLQEYDIVRNVMVGDIPLHMKTTVEECFSDDPIYDRIKKLFHEPDSAKTRAALQLNLVKMSAIQNEFTRTTKRQIRNELSKVNERFPCTIKIGLTCDEQREFDRVINDYEEKENASGSSNLGLVQIKRMVSSSVYGYCNERKDLESGIDAFADKTDAKVEALIKEILTPSKSNHMREIRKIIVFAVFVDTLKYLKIRLAQRGVDCLLMDGGVADRQNIIDRFREDDRIRVLLSSEVGSEGLDMQFCDTIVNYDLPWNPMVVEQRIGRIDRIGQKSEKIYIYNFVVKGSITEDIYARLESRIDIFKGTIGDLEPILSANFRAGQSILEAHNNIETRYYRGEITKEQALHEEELINQAIEAQRMTLEELSNEMSRNTISMDSYYDEQINYIQKRKAYVTDVELCNLLKKVLNIKETQCSQCVLEMSGADERIWKLKIPQNLDDRGCLERFLLQNRPRVSDSLRAYDEFIKGIRGKTELTLTFNQAVANENHGIIFVNNYSPLIQACNEYRASAGMVEKKVFKLELWAEGEYQKILERGDRFFLLNYQLEISDGTKEGVSRVKELCPILFDIARGEIVSDENVISSVCCLAQDGGRDTQMPSTAECSKSDVAKFKALATRRITQILAEKKQDIDEQNNVERNRWIKEHTEFYDNKISYYQDRKRDCEIQLEFTFFEDAKSKLKNEIAGYAGTITRLMREKEEKLAKLDYESDVSISREEVSACYVVIR